MNYTTSKFQKSIIQNLFTWLVKLALLTLIAIPCLGILPEGYAGWLTNPPVEYELPCRKKKSHKKMKPLWQQFHWQAAWEYACHSLPGTGYQMGLMIFISLPLSLKKWGWGLLALPIVRWMVAVSAIAWPWWGQSVVGQGLRQLLYRSYQVSVFVLAGASVYHVGSRIIGNTPLDGSGTRVCLLGGIVKREAKGWQVTIEESTNGKLEITLTGPNGDRWFLRHQPVDEFERRMLITILRHIWTPEDTPQRPFLRQEWLASGFDTHQELISRWESYQQKADWRRMMSKRGGELMTWDEIGEIIDEWATNFWWTSKEVLEHLEKQGKMYSLTQVKEAGRLSGFLRVKRRMRERFRIGSGTMKPKDSWLTTQLFEQIKALLNKVETGEGLTPEDRLEIEALQKEQKALGLEKSPETNKSLPWMYRMQNVLFGWWEEAEDESVRCIYCGSRQVTQKSKKPRNKPYYDGEGNLKTVAVYRYYCQNPTCERDTFTNLPPNLVPHSAWTMEVHMLALQGYAWGQSTYRRVGQAVGVSTATTYRWVSAWGEELLPMRYLFGMVRSTGVVGVDEKWVKVPKNDKPEGKRKEWMYVYMAVDVYTYDLLHIAIYPYLTKASAHAFLLELRAKGYKPRVIVTDLRQDYGDVVDKVFPKARHHECIFHAMKWIQREIKNVYGADYKEEHPDAVKLKEDIYAIFQCKDKRTSRKRYEQVMTLRQKYVEKESEAKTIFNTLENHWPKLVNAMGSKIIPKTNNAVELVNRRFNQHYQNFCGFETIETAQCYLAVFELVYRFTPFAKYNTSQGLYTVKRTKNVLLTNALVAGVHWN